MTRLETLKKMRAEVVRERDQLNVELSRIDDLIAMHQPAEQMQLQSDTSHVPLVTHKKPGFSLSSPGIMQTAISVCLELYDARPHVVKTGNVLYQLGTRGQIVGGKSPSGNVSSYLKHSDDLANIRGHGWVRKGDLAEWKAKLNINE